MPYRKNRPRDGLHQSNRLMVQPIDLVSCGDGVVFFSNAAKASFK